MPKTRHEKFVQCFSRYAHFLHIDGTDYSLNYNLINNTDNHTKSIHSYTLHILGTMETFLNTGENVVEILPTNRQMIENMRLYFEPYQKMTANGRRKVSFIHISTEENDDRVSEINFDIHYYKQYLPFPAILTPIEELQEEIGELHGELHEMEKMLNRVKKRYRIEKERLSNTQKTIQKNISNLYTLNTKLDDCPVCMEPIEKNNLYVPICFHNICMTCAERCNKCPLCREVFVNIDIS
jgi:chromosome segregation ATPase